MTIHNGVSDASVIVKMYLRINKQKQVEVLHSYMVLPYYRLLTIHKDAMQNNLHKNKSVIYSFSKKIMT